MRIFLNQLASRFFKFFLFLTLALPVLVVLLLSIIALLGFADGAFIAALYVNQVFFSPVQLIFGYNIVPSEEFGPNPDVKGFIITILFYVAVSYFLANAIGAVVGRKNAR